MNTIDIIMFFISLIGIGVVIYFIYSTWSSSINWLTNILNIAPPKPCNGGCYNEQICDLNLNKCRKNCKEGESYYDIGSEGICCDNTTHEIVENVCTPKCPTGQIRCGSTDCLDPATDECVNDKICKKQFVAYKETETGGIIKKCCGKDNIGNQLYPKNGDCVFCLGTKCGSNCCPTIDGPDAKDINHPENKNPGSSCVSPDYCCNPKFIGKDDVTGKDVCCQTELCGDKCCSGNKSCNKNAVGGPKCQIKCGDSFCPDDSDLCVSNNGTLKCYPSTCKWEQTNYVPPAIYDKTGGVQKLRSVCLAGGNVITSQKPMVAVSGVNTIMSSDTSISLSATENNQRCKTVDACLGKIQQLGLEKTIYNDTLTIKDNNRCQGKVNCSNLLPTNDQLKTTYGYTRDANLDTNGYYNKTLCPAKKEDGADDVNCCYDRITKEFNGYVCPDNQLCYNDILSDAQYCYKKGSTTAASYNLNNCSNVVEPTIIKNTLTCNCPQGTHAGTKCQYSNATQCSNNGTVTSDKNDNFNCICSPGFTGINCQNIKILKESDLSLAGVLSGVCDWCHIVPGPGVSLTLNPDTSTREYKSETKLFGTVTVGATVLVKYTGKYKKGGTEFSFTGDVSLINCGLKLSGNFPTVTGTDNFVVKSSLFGVSAAVAVIGIPINLNVVAGTEVRYIDWDNNECPASDVKTTNYWKCSDPKFETCCSNNLTSWSNCAYDLSPCNRLSSNLSTDKPAFNKSIIQSSEGKGYYYV